MNRITILKKKIYIDLSWISVKYSGGGNQAATNVLESIINNKKIIKNFNITIIARSNFFKKKKFPKYIDKIILPNYYLFNFIIRWFILLFLFKKNQKQIYFCTNIYSPIIKLNFKIINIFYDNQWKYFPKNFSYIRILWIKINIYLSKILSDKILCISDFIKNEFSDNKSKFLTIYIPVKQHNNYLKPKNINYKFALTISSILPHKNLEVLEKIYLKNNIKSIPKTLVIAGVGGQKKIINNNDKKIVYLGNISENEKNWLLKNCEFYVSPSLYEGLGMTLIEAYFKNKKIICSKLKVFKETLGTYPIYVNNPKNEKNWLSELNKISNIRKRKNIFLKIRNNFNSKKISQKYYSLFKEVIK